MSYTDHEHIAGSYDAAAAGYSTAWQEEDELPHAKLENELVQRMLGDCSGYKIMDIAGGSGGHARQAIAAGASHVDVVDLSSGMMEVGKGIEAQAGRDVIGWHLADVFRPVAEQVPTLPLAGYDLVMAMWPFDHAANVSELLGLYENIAAYLKTGGRLVAVRVGNPSAESAATGKYGSKFHDVQPIDGGVRYVYTMLSNPPFTIKASSMETSMSGSTELPDKVGITDVKVFNLAETETVRADPSFWELMLKDPHFVAFTGVKN